MNYFDINSIQTHKNAFGAQYNSNPEATKWFNQTKDAIVYLAKLLSAKLNIELKLVYKEKPNTRPPGQKLKNYVLGGFIPSECSEEDNLFIMFIFSELNTSSPEFTIKFEQNQKASNKPYDTWLAEGKNQNKFVIPVDSNFPANWDDLVQRTSDHVKKLIEIRLTMRDGKIEPNAPGGADVQVKKEEKKVKSPQNLILYGPPGTGKTYHSIHHALALIEGSDVEVLKKEERELVKQRFDAYLTQGRIVFCTFHQSMSYEDFIEGLKPLVLDSEENSSLKFEVRDGLFKKLCTEAAFSIAQQLDQPKEGYIDSFDVLYDAFVSEVNEKLDQGETILLDSKNSTLLVDGISEFGNFLIKHREDSRIYTVSKRRLSKLFAAFPYLNQVSNIYKDFRSVIGGSNASAYWAVLNALRKRAPLPIEAAPILDSSAYSYESKIALIEQIPASKFKEATGEPFVMIIDEINRGNIAQIFGELITLLEPDKRLGMAEGLRLTLPYSGDSFGVPHNLHIIGTMNTADRSVEALDTALRRRFSFIFTPPQPDLEDLKPTEEGIDLGKILRTLNTRLQILKDKDHTIGHAWLLGVKNLTQLQATFGNKILPLLQEYFYNDYEKLGLVLGDPFFEKKEQVNSNIFAKFTGSNGLAGQYNQAWQYELKPADKLELGAFQSLENQAADSQ